MEKFQDLETSPYCLKMIINLCSFKQIDVISTPERELNLSCMQVICDPRSAMDSFRVPVNNYTTTTTVVLPVIVL